MTINLYTNTTAYRFAVNVANLTLTNSPVPKFMVRSQAANDIVYSWDAEWVETNDRFTLFNLTVPLADLDNHNNGIYEYWIEQDGTEIALIPRDLVKIVNAVGGSTGMVEYVSDNDQGQKVIYYRPKYS